MLIYVNDVNTGQALAINPNHVAAVFEAADGELQGKTIINLINGAAWPISQSQIEVVGMINGALNH